jgi:DNA repair exonuclease SbcCD ATPase subunit
MNIKNIKITDFKSIYGTQEFDFTTLDGLIKLSGVIGSGKTTIGEAILWGLYGKHKEHKNPNLIAWHCRSCEVELNLTSKGKDINIKRNSHKPLEIYINGKLLSASNKRDTQEILEEEYFDVPALAIQKMCIISFNAFNNSLAAMTPGETRLFLDDIFGFRTFTEYNDEIVNERKTHLQTNSQLNAVLSETQNQIRHLQEKKEAQKRDIKNSIDVNALKDERKQLVDKGIEEKNKLNELTKDYSAKHTENIRLMTEAMTLGRQEKEYINKFKSGKCPTCGHDIDMSLIEESKIKMQEHADVYRKYEALNKDLETKHNAEISVIQETISLLKQQINEIDSKISQYNNSIKLISENYDEIIQEYEEKIIELEDKIAESDKDIGEWNDMNELFSKTLRYGLLDTLIPHINKSIKYYMTKLDQEYTVKYDQEFKPHIYINNNDNEISYKDLSTGQRKTLDIAIIFGVIQNVIANVDFNIFFLDELFSNMDSDSRNTMLNLLKDTLSENRTIFVVNHSEMSDDYFNHKIRVHLNTKKITDSKKKEDVIVKASKYEQIF